MEKKFYIDESGNTGDLIITKNNSNFSSQEYFTLACISLNDAELDEINEYIKKLKLKYKIQTSELKFSKMKGLFGKKTGFILELLKYIETNCSFIIEIVDKKYIVCTNIVHCFINPPYEQSDLELSESKKIHQEYSQWVYDNISLDFLIKFTDVARNPSENSVDELFCELLSLTQEVDDPSSQDIYNAILKSLNIFKKFKKNKHLDRDAYTYFLPLPETNKKGKLIGILPYVGSFYNIHARLNSLFDRDLSEVVLVHDNQSHFDEIIKLYHESAVVNTNEYSKVFNNADFVFLNISSLVFRDDKDSIGLQIADLFAGFVNKAIPYLINDEEKHISPILCRVLASLHYQGSFQFVLPKKHNERLINILDSIINATISMSLSGVDIDEFDNFLINNHKDR
ncbi:DUF3800 domain-containing protein [Acinetobacter nosocomialis]|uniref:DUF3800 domain-containing protein n=1 Tax=Acinetobacter nosocomialis TaxID=106654 RepID=UPI00054B637B|nr:DUF3800 domain-containing protein [Acinetobacter nosocomialis]